jgi:hypothetical protein
VTAILPQAPSAAGVLALSAACHQEQSIRWFVQEEEDVDIENQYYNSKGVDHSLYHVWFRKVAFSGPAVQGNRTVVMTCMRVHEVRRLARRQR